MITIRILLNNHNHKQNNHHNVGLGTFSTKSDFLKKPFCRMSKATRDGVSAAGFFSAAGFLMTACDAAAAGLLSAGIAIAGVKSRELQM